MRTDLLIRRAFLLSALLWAAPSPGAAQGAPPEPPDAPPSPETTVAASDGQSRVFTGDHTIAEGEVVEDVVVVGGDLRVAGEVTGDAVLVGGDLILEETGRILGDAIVTGGEIIHNGGEIFGEMRTVDGLGVDIEREIRAELDEESERDRRRIEMNREIEEEIREARSERSWFDPIREGFAGLISTLAFGLVLAGIGAALVFYGRSHLETVSDTLRSSTLRSAAVGLAAEFLMLPVFVVLIVALAVSIIGIPFLLVAVPLYPLAIAAAVAMGLLAAAHAIGERTVEQQEHGFNLRYRNSYAYLFTGLAMLITPLLAAHLIGMTGFLGFLGVLLQVVTWVGIAAAATVGLGAVILSRAGTRRAFATPPAEPMLDSDPLFADEPDLTEPHV